MARRVWNRYLRPFAPCGPQPPARVSSATAPTQAANTRIASLWQIGSNLDLRRVCATFRACFRPPAATSCAPIVVTDEKPVPISTLALFYGGEYPSSANIYASAASGAGVGILYHCVFAPHRSGYPDNVMRACGHTSATSPALSRSYFHKPRLRLFHSRFTVLFRLQSNGFLSCRRL